MKRTAAWLLVLVLLMGLCACTNTNQPAQTEAPTTANPTNPTEANPTEPTADKWAEYEIITIAKALELCGEPGNLTTDRYYIRGTIVSIDTAWSADYKNITVNMEFDGKILQCYRLSGEGADALKVGDTITVAGMIKNYKGTI